MLIKWSFNGVHMTNYEARIRTKFGELVVHFDNKEELDQRLKEVQDLTRYAETQLAEFTTVEATKPITGFEDIYAVAPEGSIKLLKYPEKKADVIRLLLFFSSKPLSTDEIRSMVGIDNPAAYMTADDFVELPNGMYTISPEGRTVVASKIISQLRSSNV